MFTQHKNIKYKFTPLQKNIAQRYSIFKTLNFTGQSSNKIKVHFIKMIKTELNKCSNKNLGTIYLELLAQYKMI